MSELWQPLPYMKRAADFLCGTTAGGLPLEPGARKTSITLSAFSQLLASGVNKRMLVIAPLRVCRTVWPAEVRKWREFEHLRVSLILGDRDKREKAVAANADIYVINPESVAWLCTYLQGKPWPFDVVCIDELTKFKNSQSGRSKALRPLLRQANRRWGLTGSLTSNGYLDVFGQQLMLDGGAALGPYITRYKDKYFQSDFTGFVWTLRPGADKQIAAKIAPYWFQVDPKEYAELPDIVDDPRTVLLDAKQRALYKQLEKEYLISLPGGVITAANAASCYTKLSQFANGAVYDENRTVVGIHDAKLEALDDLVEELNGSPLLIGYEFQHDLTRFAERFKQRYDPDGTRGWELPCLGGGGSASKEAAWVAQWNRGELPIMAAHPQSAGHGLNLQEASANHVVWFGLPWSWELYDQFIRRVRRSGNAADRVFNHMLIVADSIDEIKLTAVRNKLRTHSEFMGLLTAYIKGEKPMTDQTAQAMPPGWVTPVKIADTNGLTTAKPAVIEKPKESTQEQRQRIRDSVTAFTDATFTEISKNPAPPPSETIKSLDEMGRVGVDVGPTALPPGPFSGIYEEAVRLRNDMATLEARLTSLMYSLRSYI